MQVLYAVAILIAAPVILFPAVRLLQHAKLAIGLLTVGTFIAIVVHGLRNGELDRTLPETCAAARAAAHGGGARAAVVALSLVSRLTR